MKMGSSQQYCLRWNNHRSNLLTVFDQLLQNEAFTDVTLACDGGTSVKCHKMVLAACSPYFQCLFTELPCRHPVVVLKDVKYNDMKAILEYMYRGEVNVAHDQLGALLKVAEALKVKGLVEENGREANSSNSLPLSTTKSEQDRNDMNSPPRIGTSSTSISSVPHSSVSPPHSTHGNGENCLSNSYSKSPYLYGKSPVMDRTGRINLPMWAVPLPHHPSPVSQPSHPHAAATAAAAMLSSCYEAASSDMSPLKRKKLQSLLMSRDTPILRTVLGQGQVDSSQPVPLVCHPDTQERIHSNGSAQENERAQHAPRPYTDISLMDEDTSPTDKNVKGEPAEDAPSPYTDISLMDDETSPTDKNNKSVPTSSPQAAFPSDMRNVTSGIATYVPQQKPEWKRYKQYTRNDILSAIEAVRTGMSALQAARKYGVPSRTLYDKVKKLGITTSRPFKRGTNGGNSNSFPYNMSAGLGHVFSGVSENEEAMPPHPSGTLLEPMFLQHALERSKGDFAEREALIALASAHAQASAGSNPGSRHSGSNNNSSPENNGRSPSPNMLTMKYMRHGSMTPSPNNDERMDDEDQVEDLSITRKEIHPPPTGSVIVPPMSLLAKKAEELAEISRERDLSRIRREDLSREREERENDLERERERVREIKRETEREMERDRQEDIENHSSDDSRRE